MHLAVNVSLKKANIRLGPEINLETLDQLTNMPLTKRIGVSQINDIYDHLGLMTPLTICYKLVFQKNRQPKHGLGRCVGGRDKARPEKDPGGDGERFRHRVPRAVVPANVKPEFELQGFWDGGKPASAEMIYARYQVEESNNKQTHSVWLLMSKANHSFYSNRFDPQDQADGAPVASQGHHCYFAWLQQVTKKGLPLWRLTVHDLCHGHEHHG